MLFNSIVFIVFFLVVTSLYFMLSYKYRGFMLLVASCVFYMFFKIEYILILLGTIVVDYIAGIYIEGAEDSKRKKVFLIISLIANIGVLAVFKYYNFINDNITGLLSIWNLENPIPALSILLPIGLSFHTFQAMSYTIEVYRGTQKAERNFWTYALYVMYYPQLVAGPIERPQNMLHQFYEKHDFDYSRAISGLRLMLWGFFAKVVVADNLSVYVNRVYDNLPEQNAVTCLIAVYFFSIQIYCDFYGYTSIARGASRIMGIELMQNFNLPYFATSIRDFWSKWHISLSTWFRDYLYIPLGGNRVAKPRMMFNLFIVFLVSGLWHGANWTFIIWGALHGLFLLSEIIINDYFREIKRKLSKFFGAKLWYVLSLLITFHLVSLAWIFFRAPSLAEAVMVCKTVLFELPSAIIGFMHGESVLAGINLPSGKTLPVLLLMIATFFLLDKYRSNSKALQFFNSKAWLRYSMYSVFLLCIFLYGYMEDVAFIYFQF